MFNFVDELLKDDLIIDDLKLQEGESAPFSMPAIVKASLLILDQMREDGSLFNIIVLPDRRRFFFLLAVAKLLYDIDRGKIEDDYNPSEFEQGDILTYEKDYVQFVGIFNENGREKIELKIKGNNLTLKCPIEIMPFLQKVETNRRLTDGKYILNRIRELFNETDNESSKHNFLKELKKTLTHFTSSMLCISPVISFKDQMLRYSIGGEQLSELIYVGRANDDGETENVFKGQYVGKHPIILASDMYKASNVLKKGHKIQSLILEAPSNVADQIYYLDELMRFDRPILIVSDMDNSFELDILIERDFKLWRWDKTNISPVLYGKGTHIFDQRVKMCANLNFEFLNVGFDEASKAMRLIIECGRNVETSSLITTNIYEKLSSLAFEMFRETTPFEENRQREVQVKLEEMRRDLQEEVYYLDDATFHNYSQLIDSISSIYSPQHENLKHNALLDYVIECGEMKLCLIVPNNTEIGPVQHYWDDACMKLKLPTNITIMYPNDYLALERAPFDAVLVSGWLNRVVMQRLLFSNKSEHYIVFLYRYEQRWKNSSLSVWDKSLRKNDNLAIAKNAMKLRDADISLRTYYDTINNYLVAVDEEFYEQLVDEEYDEQSLIEENLDKIRYSSYEVRDGDSIGNVVPVEAIAVDFAGDYFVFYRENHKVTDVTTILMEDEGDDERVQEVPAKKLEVGRYIVMRESGRDVIREIADNLLKREGKIELRETSTRWMKALEHEQQCTGYRWIIKNLREAGCERDEGTMRNWLYDEDMISPQRVDDIKYIAIATGDDNLFNSAQEVFDAATYVKEKHREAGRQLSKKLKDEIAGALRNRKDQRFDNLFNSGDPYEMEIDGIGKVIILKTKTVKKDKRICVDASKTNCLLKKKVFYG